MSVSSLAMKRNLRVVKLVRDRIPEIVARERGPEAGAHRVAGKREYLSLLRRKLKEEADEYLASGKAEERADILEVVRALGEAAGVAPRRLEELRRRKARERGGFGGRKVMIFKVTRGCARLRKDT